MLRLRLTIFCLLASVLSVAAKDKKVEIVGQKSLQTYAGQPITVHLSDIIVQDPENRYPDGFVLIIDPSKDCDVNGTTVTPHAGFTGTLRLSVRVERDHQKSKKFDLKISVLANGGGGGNNNKAPTITGQVPLSVQANQTIDILFSYLTVTDGDDHYPDGFTLKILPGNNYASAGNKIIPAKDFKGTLTVPVKVNDGKDDSPVFNLKIMVQGNSNQSNAKPVITGQASLSTNMNEALLMKFSDLTVNDSDDNYPAGFSLTVYPGNNYTSSGRIITPKKNYVGDLSVRVTVNDGKIESEPYNVRINILPVAINHKPVITGQVGLTTFKNQPITIQLANLVVVDPDNSYPADFTLHVMPGSNYGVVGNTVTPPADYVGVISVGVTVSDGTNTSDVFNLSIRIVEKATLQIVGQRPLTTNEDSTLTLALSHLIVNDPQGRYPTGFSLKILTNENFTLEGQTIRPKENFNGNLTLGVSVVIGNEESTPFNLLIVVNPVNDAPEILDLETEALIFTIDGDPVNVTQRAVVNDVDHDDLMLAEVKISTGYQPDHDVLVFDNSDNIQGVFDNASGILTFVGKSSVDEYQQMLRSVRYTYENPNDTLPAIAEKTFTIKLNDGQAVSETYSRTVDIIDKVKVNIPNAFTPNDDLANDTWVIEPLKESASFRNAHIRVYNKRGLLVFESDSFDKPWDGKLNGEFLPPESYFYTIEVELSYTTKRYKGVVTILR